MLTRWQSLYRRLIFRFPRLARAWRWAAWKVRDPRAPRNMHYAEPFPRWFGMTDEEEEWARGRVREREVGLQARAEAEGSTAGALRERWEPASPAIAAGLREAVEAFPDEPAEE